MSRISNQQTDVWSYGVVSWELMTLGLIPYGNIDNGNMISFLNEGKRLSCPSHYNYILYEVILECWHFNNKLRPTFNELVFKVRNVITTLERGPDNNTN